MKNNSFLRKSLLLALTVALVAMMVAPAFAASQTEDSTPYWTTANAGELKAVHPSYGTAVSAYSFTFNASLGGYLSNVTVQLRKVGTPSGVLAAALYGCENVYNHAANTTLYIAASTSVDIDSDLTDSYGNFTFGFDETYQLLVGEKYAIVIYVASGTVDSSNYVRLAYYLGSSHSTYMYSFKTGYYSSGGANDCDFVITSNTESGGEPPIVEPPGYSQETLDSMLSSFVSFMVPLIIILLPAMLLMFITRRVDKWLLIIGITIGVGLGYYLMPASVPLWLVFLVTIGLIGMAYQSVRGGNS